MKSTNTNLIVCILNLFAFYQASALSTIKFARELNDRLNRDIDTNFLLFGHVKEQDRSPYICGSADGPYCKLISGQSLSDLVVRGSEAIEKKKVEVQAYMAKISEEVEERKTKTNDFFIVFTNDYRDNALGYKNKKNSYEVQIYLNFEDFPLQSYDSEMHTPYTFTYDPSTFHGAFNAMPVNSIEQTVQMEFPNIHLPPSEKVFSKYNQKEADSDKITNDKSTINPYGVYLFTEEKFSGEIKFSKPVKISQFYLRKHNFIAYQREHKGQPENKIEFIAKGYLKGVLVEQYQKSYFGTTNKWTKITPQSPKEIDRLWIDANQDLDNLLFDLEHKAADIKLVETTFAFNKDTNTFVKASSLGDNLAKLGPVIELIQENDGSVKIMKDGQLQYRIKEGTNNEEVFKLISDMFPEFEGYKEQIIAQGKEMMKKYDGQFKTISTTTSNDGSSTTTTTITTPTSTAKITKTEPAKQKEDQKPKTI